MNDMKKLLILGAGQYGKVAYEIASAMEQFERIEYLDDNSETAVGKLSDYKNLKMTMTALLLLSVTLKCGWI